MFTKLTVKDVKVRNQNVLVRVDYNVPLKDGEITDDLRIKASLPTIEYLIKKGARRVILISHLGRPEGKRVKELSLRPVAERLKELLPDNKVNFIDDVSGPDVEEAVEKTPVGGVLLLENLRFFPGEEKNSSEFAREIAECTKADLFVQDGFDSCGFGKGIQRQIVNSRIDHGVFIDQLLTSIYAKITDISTGRGGN